MATLVDTGILLALEDSSDRWHERSLHLLESTAEPLLVTAPVLTEACHLLVREFGYGSVEVLLRDVGEGAFEFHPLLPEDLSRAHELVVQYADASFDFADVTLIALA